MTSYTHCPAKMMNPEMANPASSIIPGSKKTGRIHPLPAHTIRRHILPQPAVIIKTRKVLLPVITVRAHKITPANVIPGVHITAEEIIMNRALSLELLRNR